MQLQDLFLALVHAGPLLPRDWAVILATFLFATLANHWILLCRKVPWQLQFQQLERIEDSDKKLFIDPKQQMTFHAQIPIA